MDADVEEYEKRIAKKSHGIPPGNEVAEYAGRQKMDGKNAS